MGDKELVIGIKDKNNISETKWIENMVLISFEEYKQLCSIEEIAKKAFIAGYKIAIERLEQRDKDIVVDFYSEFWNKEE